MKKTDAESIFIDDLDIDYIARVVQTEVPPVWRNEILAIGAAAIVDTILNRVAYAGFPDNVTDVLNQKYAFSKINGPKYYYNSKLKRRVALEPYGSVQKAPRASPKIDSLVRRIIAYRAAGGESIVGSSLHYGNPNPAYSGRNAMAPNGFIYKIQQTPALVTGFGKNYTHVHGTDPSMRPLLSAPQVKFLPSANNQKEAIDDIEGMFQAPAGLDWVAPPIPAPKYDRFQLPSGLDWDVPPNSTPKIETSPINPARAVLIDHTDLKPLSFNEYYQRSQSRLGGTKDSAGEQQNGIGTRKQDIFDIADLALDQTLARLKAEQDFGHALPPGPKPEYSGIPSANERVEDTEDASFPVPKSKPSQVAPSSPYGDNPFELEKPRLKQQARLIEENPVLAKRMIRAAGRDPELFGFA